MRKAEGQGWSGKISTAMGFSRKGFPRNALCIPEVKTVTPQPCWVGGAEREFEGHRWIFPPWHSLWGGSLWRQQGDVAGKLEGEWETRISLPRTALETTSSHLITNLPWCQGKYPQVPVGLTYSEYSKNFCSPCPSPPFSLKSSSLFLVGKVDRG